MENISDGCRPPSSWALGALGTHRSGHLVGGSAEVLSIIRMGAGETRLPWLQCGASAALLQAEKDESNSLSLSASSPSPQFTKDKETNRVGFM